MMDGKMIAQRMRMKKMSKGGDVSPMEDDQDMDCYSQGGEIMDNDADDLDDEPMGDEQDSDEFLAHSGSGEMVEDNHAEVDGETKATKKRGRLERVMAQIRMEQSGKKS